MAKPYIRLDKDNAAVLLVDHQTGLLSLVRDIDPDKFKNNVLALAAAAKYFNLPTILTTSFEDGPNGPLIPELVEMFPDAPYIARPGQINAWDNQDFVQAVKATGKKQLIIAGVVTEVCVAFPALSALEEEFDVFVITDASGNISTNSGTKGSFGPSSKLVVRMVGRLKYFAAAASASALFLNLSGSMSRTNERRPAWWSTKRTAALSLSKRI